jgi:very-short-patch-repair endonuclease
VAQAEQVQVEPSQLPTDRVVQLLGTDAQDLALRCARGGGELPATVTHRTTSPRTPAAFARPVLDELESVAVELYPAWLPEAEAIHTPGGAGLVAVRAVATRHGAGSGHFGPFLANLAALALSGRQSGVQQRFPPEVRARGLARVVAEGLARPQLVLIVLVPPGLDPAAEQVIAAGSEWLAANGRFGVWLAGAPLASVDWLPRAGVPPSAPAPTIETAGAAGPADAIGRPHPNSACEHALEAALRPHTWAVGRRWNEPYQSHALTQPIRLDLVWPAERCVVEIDGPEHRGALQFELDHQRDVRLSLDGYTVLRFTNARIRHDVGSVVRQIGTLIRARRSESVEGQQDGR